MKILKPLFTLTVIMLVFSATTFAQATATATAAATILSPITISQENNLDFGHIINDGTAFVVTVDPDGTRSSTGGVITLSSAGSAGSPAIFSVTGEADQTYSITIPTATLTLTHSGGAAIMTADNWTSTPTTTDGGTIGANEDKIKVGANLNVSADQTTGTYTSANFDVTVNYN